LCAADVLPENIEQFADIVGKYDEVTHNYLREGHPNCWFTLIAPTSSASMISYQSWRSDYPLRSFPAFPEGL